MSARRPTISPDLIAALIEATPERVRRRLDKAPDVAESWTWQASESSVSINTGGETVTLPLDHVIAIEQLTCSCLLSPRCFHVLACLTRLEVALVESPAVEAAAAEADDDHVAPTEKQRHAAHDLVNSLAQLLRVGVVNAGVVVQSGLLRAVHQCRAEGLHRLAALGLRVLTGIAELRSRGPTADPAQLAEDVAQALETSQHLQSTQPIPTFWLGTPRRRQWPVRPRKLHGLFAEPILTRTGYAGAAVYFLGEDDCIYTASEVRPGDAQLARDAYLGGIEIGSLIQPARQLARGVYLGSDLTASQDGRLGRGKSIKIAGQGPSSWQAEAIQTRLRRPLADQWQAVYALAELPADARPAGWDFVFLEGSVLGAAGPELLFQPAAARLPLRLTIENESESLCFRENLRMLSHAPGLRLQVIARVNPHEPRMAAPLAIGAVPGEVPDEEPRLEIPESLTGRLCMGFDEIQRHQLINAQPSAVVLAAGAWPLDSETPLSPLRRRWIATMLAGIASQRPSRTSLLAAETAALGRTGFTTGAALLDALSRSPSDDGPDGVETFLATALYLRSSAHELARARAMLQE